MIINPGIPRVGETPGDPERQDVPAAEPGAADLDAARSVASKMNAAEELWYVMYGAGSRSYWAFPLWDPGMRLVLESTSPTQLLAAMREAETRYAGRRSHPATAGHADRSMPVS